MDYARQDHDRILAYIDSEGGQTTVERILNYSSAERLRVYNLLQVMEMDGEIEVPERSFFGAPAVVRRSRR